MLKRVSIQNFKSLKDVTLDLQKVNLLIGPNNSGKTNFLKALEFISTFAENRISPLKNLHYKQDISDSIVITTNFVIYQQTNYFLPIITQIQLIRDNGFKYQLYEERNNEVSGRQETNAVNSAQWDSIAGEIIIYKPDPNKLDKPAPVGKGDNFVAADASNLVAFFDKIRDEYSESLSQIKTDLFKCVPEFTEINFQNVGSTQELVEQFGDKTFKRIGLTDGKQRLIYWADELSEGTLYFIALLCIINQPNPPKILLLEEPEKGIHPRRIHEVIQFIFRLAEEKDVQVIMTTHSPIVVDLFKDMPESVFIFDKNEEGATYVKNLQTDIIEPETEESKRSGIEPPHYTSSLGNAWTVGFLGGVPK